MLERVYFYLFISCVFLAHGIAGSFLEEDKGESMTALVRNKRVINRSSVGEKFLKPGEQPYIVNIKLNRRSYCIGSILSHHTIITAARCVTFDLYLYIIVSGAVYTTKGQNHNVIGKKINGKKRGGSDFVDGIALMSVDQPFVYSQRTASIALQTQPLPVGVNATVSGWGSYLYKGQVETKNPQKIRSITVPIMNRANCLNFYRGIFEIRDEYICTLHGEKQCAYNDAGAPLVVGSKLVGIFLGEIESIGRNCSTKPDIFFLLQHAQYRNWISTNVF